MDKYTPEMIAMLLNTIKNCVLIVTCGTVTVSLFYLSRSWYSLLALLPLLLQSSVHFIRD